MLTQKVAVHVRLTQQERSFLQRLANDDGTSTGRIVGTLVRQEIERRGLTRSTNKQKGGARG